MFASSLLKRIGAGVSEPPPRSQDRGPGGWVTNPFTRRGEEQSRYRNPQDLGDDFGRTLSGVPRSFALPVSSKDSKPGAPPVALI